MTTIRTFALLCLGSLTALAGCAAADSPHAHDSSRPGSGDAPAVLPAAAGEAVWKLHHDENLALPHCAACDGIVDRTSATCTGCGAAAKVVGRDIACPACEGSTECAHCAGCIACESTGRCGICDGSATLDGETCPECEGAAACVECGPGAGDKSADAACTHCAESGSCANCAGSGSIRLE